MKKLVEQHFSLEKNPTNIVKLLGLMAVVYGLAKTQQLRGLISASGRLHEIPAVQSVEVPNSARSGQTPILRNFKVPAPQPIPAPTFQSLHHTFAESVRLYPDNKCFGSRKLLAAAAPSSSSTAAPSAPVYSDYQWMSYREVAERAHCFGSGLKHLTDIERQGFLGLYAQNTPQWMIAETAANAFALVTIPLYDTLGAEAAQYIIRQTEMTTVFCSPLTLDRLLEISGSCPSLKYLVVTDDAGDAQLTPHMREEAARRGLTLFSVGEVENHGARAAVRIPLQPPTIQDMATLMYTSGTTGDPKGVILTHGNFMAAHASLTTAIHNAITQEDVHLSYLPLAHVFERMVMMLVLSGGGSVGFFRGNILWLLEDMALLRPTIFPSVPRLLNRIQDKIMAAVQGLSPLKQKLFHYGYNAKKQNLYESGASIHPFWDKLLFQKFAAVLGGRVRWIITGAAPISVTTLEFLRIVFSCTVVEGYGQTENTAVGTVTVYGDVSTGHVGPPSPATELKLVDVPDMDYLSTNKPNPRGEICVKGPGVFAGYYKMPDKTAEAVDSEGWLHSGDIGELLPNGCIKIIDRKKNLFKLAQGEYVAPEKIENIITRSAYIAQAFVYGDSLQSHLVAIVVPDEEVVAAWSRSNDLAHKSFSELCRSDELHELIFADIVFHCKAANLGGFEVPKAIYLSDTLFSVDNDILTPTFKLKRNIAQKIYQKQITQMYQLHAAKPTLPSAL